VVGLFAATRKYLRKMPGRIVGATVDMEDRRGYVLTLQTREQQIRREKATSNICTNQGLNALAATIHLAVIGREGLREVAEASVQNAHYAARRIEETDGVELMFPETPFLREFAVRTKDDSRVVLERGLDRGILAGVSLSRFPDLHCADGLLVAFTEKRTRAEIDLLIEVLEGR
jgi:glycine dehydrogenase subunit 1